MTDNQKQYDQTARVKLTRRLSSRGIKMAAYVLVSQLVLTGIACVVMKNTTPEVVVFDMKGTVDLFMQQSARLQMDEDKARLLTTRFNAALTDSLAAWQADHNGIILVKPAVMSAQTDITAEIQQDIARRVKEGL
ncbi:MULTISPECIES: type-F conjugative transfer system protein TrbI [Enterobacteriaceae]|jgi:conjugal transfer pilin signal peptidase TrbI|uniref:IncF plasmid conjugative transfer protein TrbI n=2 Tax=Leclercia adecarboxylata TaxID=83655 RepID=A0A6H0A4G7_9ENTR|nr:MULTISPECIES: type-F conjugative transfer system protein TrbI [Enterobacteriaceae]UNJ80291.1 IncF plasmid conjugative transfer protein TrbI [Leclercia sp.]MCW4705990.1 type-F conjugative transfer system protein TrbI [Enterobacter kobei]MDV5279959.1 type-F conjugative transfer system protein TrbI [Leclercia adecarboxylata]MDV5505771.1 type-F conjugative transfer system protein TrbI [Leclercia adecarboxylata]MDV5565295.1 type-F conjugative transfer system protein TrbI [Leclercia adecarboxylat